MEVTGRNLITGLPKTMKISSTEIYEALKDPISELIEAIQAVIERTPPQLASDIFNDGIVFTGGAAALTGLCEAVYAVMKIPCGVADDPQTCVVMGCGQCPGGLQRPAAPAGQRTRTVMVRAVLPFRREAPPVPGSRRLPWSGAGRSRFSVPWPEAALLPHMLEQKGARRRCPSWSCLPG